MLRQLLSRRMDAKHVDSSQTNQLVRKVTVFRAYSGVVAKMRTGVIMAHMAISGLLVLIDNIINLAKQGYCPGLLL